MYVVLSMLLLGSLAILPASSTSPPICHMVHGRYDCLPNSLFIGVSKCGTTSIIGYLARHPRISTIQATSESHLFDSDVKFKNISSQLFKVEYLKHRVTDVVMDYTPNYISDLHSPLGILATLPNPNQIKFIVSIREPVKRVYSSYVYKYPHTHNSFAKDVHISMGFFCRWRQCQNDHFSNTHFGKLFQVPKVDKWGHLIVHKEDPRSLSNVSTDTRPNYHHLPAPHSENNLIGGRCGYNNFLSPSHSSGHSVFTQHIYKSMYALQLGIWFTYFPRSNFHIIRLEDFGKDNVKAYENILHFLGLRLLDSDTSGGNDNDNSTSYDVSKDDDRGKSSPNPSIQGKIVSKDIDKDKDKSKSKSKSKSKGGHSKLDGQRRLSLDANKDRDSSRGRDNFRQGRGHGRGRGRGLLASVSASVYGWLHDGFRHKGKGVSTSVPLTSLFTGNGKDKAKDNDKGKGGSTYKRTKRAAITTATKAEKMSMVKVKVNDRDRDRDREPHSSQRHRQLRRHRQHHRSKAKAHSSAGSSSSSSNNRNKQNSSTGTNSSSSNGVAKPLPVGFRSIEEVLQVLNTVENQNQYYEEVPPTPNLEKYLRKLRVFYYGYNLRLNQLLGYDTGYANRAEYLEYVEQHGEPFDCGMPL